MMRARRLTTTMLATLGVLAGGLALVSAPALAAQPEAPVPEAATEVTATTATLHAELNPHSEVTINEYSFLFDAKALGYCTGGGNLPEGGGLPSGPVELTGAKIKVSATATRLEPDTEYVFCVVVANREAGHGGDATGASLPFETLAVPPTASHESAALLPVGVRLEAVVNPNNEETKCEFQYEAEEPLLATPTTIPCTPETLKGFSEQGVASTVLVPAVKPGTTYYYHVIAENEQSRKEGRPTEGQTESFVTTTFTLEKPVVTSESVSAVTSSAATLQASVNPEYQETTCEFEYGTEPLLKPGTTTTVSCPKSLGNGSVGVGTSVAVTGLTAGETYHYRVVATNGTGTIEGKIESFRTEGPPLVNTGGAQNITQTAATLSGTVNPGGVESSYYFEYIAEAGYLAALAKGALNPYAEGEATPPVDAGASFATQAVGPILASGLLPGTTYDYALVAENGLGITIGPNEALTTLSSTPPTVSTGGASGLSQNTATLSGTVSTNGLQTEYGFEIGTEAGNYGPATGLGSIGGALSETVTVTLGELQPGTTYYYRVTARSGDGASYGEPETFTTPGFPTLLMPQSEPPLIGTPSIAFPTGSQENTGTTGGRGPESKRLTDAHKLSRVLTTCRKDRSKGKRIKCEKQAKAKYGTTKRKARK